ncbi:MAG: hypothetical protein M9939_19505 [Mesorhizobium sp.]|nr:hypothetical protein [Mesorhizobium sp.]MCO5163324.1 hypothetical protein [Mesorhizobium sp.]
MSWRAKAGREQKVLASIVARLFSFGDLAEDAAGRSPWMRWCILWAAWQANALLRDYVEGRAGNMTARRWSAVPMPAGFGSHPDDAQDLAASLRALALMMRAIAAQVSRVAFLQRGDGSDEAGNDGRGIWAVPGNTPAADVSRIEFRDTS